MAPSLFDKLGGRDAVNAAVDKFYGKVLADPLLAPFFKNTDMVKQRAHQVRFLSYALGGADSYKGKDMRTAHKHLALTEDHFNAVAGHLKATLEELGVAQELVDEAIAVVATTKAEVLNL